MYVIKSEQSVIEREVSATKEHHKFRDNLDDALTKKNMELPMKYNEELGKVKKLYQIFEGENL